MAGASNTPPDPPDKNAQPDAKKDVKGEGWVSRMAQRSTGLPGEKPSPRSDDAESTAQLWKYAGMGFQFAATTVIFTLIGVYLDRHMGWTPWGVIGCTMFGMIGGFYLLIKDAMRMNK